MVSNPFMVLQLWYGRDDARLGYSELLKRKALDKNLRRKTERQFIRYLNALLELDYLEKDVDSKRNTWYSKTDKARRKSFAVLLSNFVELSDSQENRDPFGASIVYCQPPLADFMTKEKIEELHAILDKANAEIVGKIVEALIRKRIGELHASEREDVVFYSKTIKMFDGMTRRLEKSGVVKTSGENEKIYAEFLEQAKLSGFDTVQKFKDMVGERFHRMFRHCPLTFEEQKEYQDLKKKLKRRARTEEFFARIEDEIPRVFCCLYNFEMEEFLLFKLDLVLCFDDVIRPTTEVLESLSKEELKEYKANIKRTLRSRTLYPPEWTGNNDALQPKMRWSWDNSTARKYLRHILISVEKKLSLDTS